MLVDPGAVVIQVGTDGSESDNQRINASELGTDVMAWCVNVASFLT